MKKLYILIAGLLFTATSFAQQATTWAVPDSGTSVVKSGSGPTPQWNNLGGLSHNGTGFTPMISSGGVDNTSDYLYLYDFDLNIPSGATILGVEVMISTAGCNQTSFDTLQLAYNGMAIGNTIADTIAVGGGYDTVGGSTNTWGNALTAAMVNSNSFGVYYYYRSVGICTYAVFDCRMKVHYMATTGVETTEATFQTKVYPNPVSESLTLVANADERSYSVFDQLGRGVMNGTITSPTTIVKTTDLVPGMYFIRLQESGTVLKFQKN